MTRRSAGGARRRSAGKARAGESRSTCRSSASRSSSTSTATTRAPAISPPSRVRAPRRSGSPRPIGAGAIAAGFIDMRAGSSAVATSNGLFGYHSGHGCGVDADDAHAGRPVVGLGRRRRRRLEHDRIANASRTTPCASAGLARQDRARSGQVRSHSRADGRRHADLAHARGLRRAAGGRGPFVSSPSAAAATVSARNSSTSASRSSAIRRRRTPRPTRSPTPACPSRLKSGSRTAC